MAKKTFTTDTNDYNIMQALSDRPNINDGKSATDMKVLFDTNGNTQKTYNNSTLLSELQSSTADDSGAQGIGFDGGGGVDNVADQLDVIIAAGSGSIPPDNTISTAKIQDDAVTNVKMDDNSVDTAEIVDGAVTVAKLDSGVDLGLAGTKQVDETDIADTKGLRYDAGSGKLEYEVMNTIDKISETTLGAPAASINVPISEAYNFYKIFVTPSNTAAGESYIQINNITTSTYYLRDFSSSTASTATDRFRFADEKTTDFTSLIEVSKVNGGNTRFVAYDDTINTTREGGFGHENSLTDDITSIQISTTTNNFDTGTKVIVYGWSA